MITGTDLAASAVIIDSIVTIWIGKRLMNTAKRETAKAAETVQPVIAAELANAALKLLPLIIETVEEKLSNKDVYSGTVRSIRSGTDKP